MEIVQIISEHKRARGHYVGNRYIPAVPIRQGCKRVQAIVKIDGQKLTRHIDIPK